MQYAGHWHSRNRVRKPYEARKRALIAHYTDNPPERLSGAVIRCYFQDRIK